MFIQSQVMYSLSRKQVNECSFRSTGTIDDNRPQWGLFSSLGGWEPDLQVNYSYNTFRTVF